MGTTRLVWRTLGGVLLMTAVAGVACTDGSDDDAGPNTSTTTTTSIPDEQKPPLLRDSWTREDLGRLAEIDVPGYENETTDLTDSTLKRVFVSHPDPEGITLTAEVRLAPCTPASCWDLAGEPGEEQLGIWRSLLPAPNQDDPDLVLEYGSDELIGDFAAFTLYYRSFVADEEAYAIGYHVLYHDDLNLIEVTVTPSGVADPVDDEALESQMPKDWAREVTADVLAAFADEFNADA